MEVRCGKCNKLFRVSDDKITGTGIKFPCSRCGEYVRITHADFEQYTLSHGAGSVIDPFELIRGNAAASLSPDAGAAVAKEAMPPVLESKVFDLAAQTSQVNALEEKAPLFVEPEHYTPALAENAEPAVEIKAASLLPGISKVELPAEPKPEQRPEPKPEPLFVPQQQAKPASEREIPSASSTQTAAPKKEYAHPVPPQARPAEERILKTPVSSATPSHSGRMLLLLFATLVIAGLVAYGIFIYFQSSMPKPQKPKEAAQEIISTEGLQVVNPVGSLEANGDLLITGVIENAIVKEKTSWYVEAVVNDAKGSDLAKIKILNGKQIFTRRDYEILASRGTNVQELKMKTLQEKGVVVPPLGSVKFEARYLQPAPGIASFHLQVLPFDPVQMKREIAAEIN